MAVLVLVAVSAAAGNRERKPSPYKYEVNVAWGAMPLDISSSWGDYYYYGNNNLDYIYGNYRGKQVTSGVISADFNIQYRKWFALGVQFNTVVISNTEMSPIEGRAVGKYSDYSLSLLPYARFTYRNREFVKVYSAIGAGLGFAHEGAPQDRADDVENRIVGRIQFIPVGFTVGRRIYGMGEIGLGTEFMGIRLGIGYRF